MSDFLKCDDCGYENSPEHSFCRNCGTHLDIDANLEEQHIEVETTAPAGRGLIRSLVELAVVVAVIIFAVAFFENVINHRRRGSRHAHARQRACMANMRVILGAVEMYNMDNVAGIAYLDKVALERLVYKKYLRSLPECPGRDSQIGIYTSHGDLTVDGHIVCTIHGSVENPKH